MSFFGIGKTCVFSEARFKLMLNGKPVSNTEVIREWTWNESESDHALTDSQGIAHFPAVYRSSISRLLPIEIVIGQQLSVLVDGKKIIFWANAKRDALENSEYGGVEFEAICELSDEEKLIDSYGSLMSTVCKLEKIL